MPRMRAGGAGFARPFDLAQCGCECSGPAVMGRGWIATRGRGGKIFFVDTDVKTGLLELLFHVNFAFLHEG